MTGTGEQEDDQVEGRGEQIEGQLGGEQGLLGA